MYEHSFLLRTTKTNLSGQIKGESSKNGARVEWLYSLCVYVFEM